MLLLLTYPSMPRMVDGVIWVMRFVCYITVMLSNNDNRDDQTSGLN